MFLIGNPSNTSSDTGASARVIAGLMREVIAGYRRFSGRSGRTSLQPSSVCGTLLFLARRFWLLTLPASAFCRLFFCSASIVKVFHQKKRQVLQTFSIEPVGHFHQLFFCKMLQIGEQLTLGSNNYKIVLVGEGNIPLAAMD